MSSSLTLQVGGGDLGAYAEPPDTAIRLKVLVVEVHHGKTGVAWVHDEIISPSAMLLSRSKSLLVAADNAFWSMDL